MMTTTNAINASYAPFQMTNGVYYVQYDKTTQQLTMRPCPTVRPYHTPSSLRALYGLPTTTNPPEVDLWQKLFRGLNKWINKKIATIPVPW